jgi:NAD(P)-dependent dehydrogenase (short-subunit alcohol dehydrogenase family)
MALDNRVALVTGGSRGIGRGIVIALANAGYDVAFTYNTDIEAADLVIKETRHLKPKILAFQMNTGNRLSITTTIRSITKEYRGINILVNNAGIAQEKPFETITDDDWANMLKVNLQGPFSLIQEIVPSMVASKWGRIINISSIGGQWGGFNQVHYAAAKAGLINLTQSIAKIYSKYGVTSNAIAPGLISTDMAEAELNSDAGSEKVKGIPMNRIGNVEEVGSSVVFLSSDEASYITGQTINLNGGMFFST